MARGWKLLSWNLLDHPEIAAAEGHQSTEDTAVKESIVGTQNHLNTLIHTFIADIIQCIGLENVGEHWSIIAWTGSSLISDWEGSCKARARRGPFKTMLKINVCCCFSSSSLSKIWLGRFGSFLLKSFLTKFHSFNFERCKALSSRESDCRVIAQETHAWMAASLELNYLLLILKHNVKTNTKSKQFIAV